MKKFLILLPILFIIPTFIPIGFEDPKPEMEIYLISNLIHTDIAVPVKNEIYDWGNFINPTDFKSPPGEWMEIGWGDREFYFKVPEIEDLTLGIAADALLWPDPGIMHVNFLRSHPRTYESQKVVRISQENYLKLVVAIQSWFKVKDGKPILIPGKGYSDQDNFYEAYGSFSLAKTCNVWTGDIFSELGLKRPLWSPTKYGLELMW